MFIAALFMLYPLILRTIVAGTRKTEGPVYLVASL
jgi:hypothetical protein